MHPTIKSMENTIFNQRTVLRNGFKQIYVPVLWQINQKGG